MCICVHGYVWRSEVNLQCHSSRAICFGCLTDLGFSDDTGCPGSPRDLPVFTSLCWYYRHTIPHPAFYMGAGGETRVFMLAQQVLCRQSHSHTPIYCYSLLTLDALHHILMFWGKGCLSHTVWTGVLFLFPWKRIIMSVTPYIGWQSANRNSVGMTKAPSGMSLKKYNPQNWPHPRTVYLSSVRSLLMAPLLT